MRPLLLIAALPACTLVAGEGALTQGAVRLCLGADAETEDPGFEDVVVWEVGGSVVSQRATDADDVFEVSDCWNRPARVLTVRDGDGVDWHLGYGLEREGDDVTPELAVAPGQTVYLDFVRTVVWGWDHGVVLRDDENHLLLAGQEGMATDLATTPGSLLSDLTVTAGEPYGPTAHLDCGRARNVLARFEGDDTVDVEAGEVREIRADGVGLVAHNAGSFEYIGQMNCTDTWGPFSWLAWAPGS